MAADERMDEDEQLSNTMTDEGDEYEQKLALLLRLRALEHRGVPDGTGIHGE
jgi:hypothetical protein